ncbi:trypsin-like serine protease [Tardiphaga sp. 172_B4_N1_3]|uniref:trypsin-like serine protease n=1 Tax=Tardiphaga sp. 172_B4_N1_3 TaxID=3240787 RepID=UPI003F8A2E6F
MTLRLIMAVILFSAFGGAQASSQNIQSRPAPKGRVELASNKLSNTYLTRLGKGRKAQIKRLRLERVLKDYDRSKVVSKSTGEPRSKVFRDLVTGSSTGPITSSLAKPLVSKSDSVGLDKLAPEDSPVFRENVRAALTNEKSNGFARIWRGEKVDRPDIYPDAVLIRGEGICTGTLITPNHVLSAAHCYCDKVSADVTVGLSLEIVSQSAQIDLAKSKTNIACNLLDTASKQLVNLNKGDLALFKLKTPIHGVKIRKIATEELIRRTKLVRAVGFGRIAAGTAGVKFAIDIPIASYDCTEPQYRTGAYSCAEGDELNAAGLNRDTCEGDSGGPTYVLGESVNLYLAAVTSRSIRPDSACGSGGIYVKLTTKKVRDWLIASGVPTSAFAQ